MFYAIGYEVSLIIGYLIGIRGQGKFRQVMFGLSTIARNKKLTPDEREHQLVMGVHHSMLELGYIYEERNKSYGFKFAKNIKNNNKKKVIKISEPTIKEKNENMIKYLLRFGGGVLVSLGLIWDDLLIQANLRLLWFIAFNIIYYGGSALYFGYLEIYWGIKKEDIEPVPIPLPVTTTSEVSAPAGVKDLETLYDPTSS